MAGMREAKAIDQAEMRSAFIKEVAEVRVQLTDDELSRLHFDLDYLRNAKEPEPSIVARVLAVASKAANDAHNLAAVVDKARWVCVQSDIPERFER